MLIMLTLVVFFALRQLDTADKWASVVSALVAIIVAIAATVSRAQARRLAVAEEVRAACQALLDEVGHRARSSLGEARVRRPAVMPLRWRHTRLPGVGSASRPDAEAGELSDLHRVFAGQRLVILGEAGSGKTCAANRLVADALDARRESGGGDPVAPVPVVVGPHGWDPGKVSFEGWLVDRIVEVYCTGDVRRNRDLVRTLLRRCEIALFLDGVDDLPLAARVTMMHELNRQETVNVVLCCRTDAYQETARHERLHGAAVIELQGLTGVQVVDYLRQCQADPPPPHWQALLDELDASPSSPLMQALENPLMLAVLRDTHNGDHPVSVRDFPIRSAAEDELLDRFTTHAYAERPDGRGPTPEQAGRTLGYLARRLERRGLRQFGWWEIPSLLPLPYRLLCSTASDGLELGILLAMAAGAAFESIEDAIVGFVVGVAVAPVLGARSSGTPVPRRLTRFRPKELVSRRHWKELGDWRNFGWTVLMGAAFGVAMVGITLTARPELLNDLDGLTPGAATAFLLVGGAFIGVIFVFALFVVMGPVFVLVNGFWSSVSVSVAEDGAPLDPVQTWRSDWRLSVRSTTMFVATAWIVLSLTGASIDAPSLPMVIAGWIAIPGATLLLFLVADNFGSARWATRVAFVIIRLHTRSAAGGMRLFEDARRRGILRTTGPRYEFRHARLQARLAAVGVRAEVETEAAMNRIMMSGREP